MRKIFLTLLSLASTFCLAAHAGTITTQTIDVFTFTNAMILNDLTYAEGTVTGTLSINVTTGHMAMFTYNLGGNPSNFHINTPSAANGRHHFSTASRMSSDGTDLFLAIPSTAGAAFSTTNGSTVNLYLPVSTLVGYTGGGICSLSYSCEGFEMISAEVRTSSFGGYFESGTLDLTNSYTINVSDTPEPSSLVLLGTGLLGGLGVVRRRLMA